MNRMIEEQINNPKEKATLVCLDIELSRIIRNLKKLQYDIRKSIKTS